MFSENPSEHIEHVDTALNALNKSVISLKSDKWPFFTKKVKYLRYIVNPDTIEVNQAAIKSLQELKQSRTLAKLKTFLGFLNVYRRFILEYTKTAQPL